MNLAHLADERIETTLYWQAMASTREAPRGAGAMSEQTIQDTVRSIACGDWLECQDRLCGAADGESGADGPWRSAGGRLAGTDAQEEVNG